MTVPGLTSERIELVYQAIPQWVWEIPSVVWLALLIVACAAIIYVRIRMVYSELVRFDANQRVIWREIQRFEGEMNERFARLLVHIRLERKRADRASKVLKPKG